MKYLIIILLLTSCSAGKRMHRILKNHPELVSQLTTRVTIRDTIINVDTAYLEGHRDTFTITRDTFIETEKLIIRWFKNELDVEVKPDTLILRDTIPYETIVEVEGKVVTTMYTPKWVWWVMGGLALFGFIMYKR